MSESSDSLAAEKQVQFLTILINFTVFSILYLRIFTVASNHRISMNRFDTTCPTQLYKIMSINCVNCTYKTKDKHQKIGYSVIKSKYFSFSFLIFIQGTDITQKVVTGYMVSFTEVIFPPPKCFFYMNKANNSLTLFELEFTILEMCKICSVLLVLYYPYLGQIVHPMLNGHAWLRKIIKTFSLVKNKQKNIRSASFQTNR